MRVQNFQKFSCSQVNLTHNWGWLNVDAQTENKTKNIINNNNNNFNMFIVHITTVKKNSIDKF